MKKFLILACVAILCLPLFIFAAVAHSGRTDSNGGHYNSVTGGYHYHHGYPAHQHYDLDGDGVIDCPYDEENHNAKYDSFETVIAAIVFVLALVWIGTHIATRKK